MKDMGWILRVKDLNEMELGGRRDNEMVGGLTPTKDCWKA